MYHLVTPGDFSLGRLVVSPARFEAQIRAFAHNGYVGITPSTWLDHVRAGMPLPVRPMMLTFDDAYADLCQHAFPVLEQHGFGAAVFVVTHRLGGVNSWDEPRDAESFRLMTENDIRIWAGRGIEFGAHTRTHPHLATLTSPDLAQEMEGSALDLEAILGAMPTSFSYPYGEYDERVLSAARHLFGLAFTVEEGIADMASDPWRLRRFMVHRYDRPRDLLLAFRLGWNPKSEIRRFVRRSSTIHGLAERLQRTLARRRPNRP
jgi:peptidoglycan/xylan/chitin deacetylase (PgdA/CDA1 family)